MDTLISASDHDDPCELWSGFDISGTAASYSQLASVLAGFAFVAMTLVLNRSYRPPMVGAAGIAESNDEVLSEDEEQHEKRVLIALGCALISLVIVAVEYSFLAGERGCSLVQGRAASAEILAGVAFIFAIYLLLYSIVQLVSSSNRQLGRHFRFIVIVVVPPLAILSLVESINDMAVALGTKGQVSQPLWNDAHTASFWMPVALGVFSLASWLLGSGRRRREKESSAAESFAITYLPYVPLVLSVAAISWSVTLPNYQPKAHISPAQAWAWISVCVIVLAAQSALLSFESKAEYKQVALPAPIVEPVEPLPAAAEVQPTPPPVPSAAENLAQMADGIRTTAVAFGRLLQRR